MPVRCRRHRERASGAGPADQQPIAGNESGVRRDGPHAKIRRRRLDIAEGERDRRDRLRLTGRLIRDWRDRGEIVDGKHRHRERPRRREASVADGQRDVACAAGVRDRRDRERASAAASADGKTRVGDEGRVRGRDRNRQGRVQVVGIGRRQRKGPERDVFERDQRVRSRHHGSASVKTKTAPAPEALAGWFIEPMAIVPPDTATSAKN